MAEIAGATVTFTDFDAPTTPRILEIPDSAGDEIEVQDIWDTLSAIAAKIENANFAKLINRPFSGGKNVLRPGKLVTITMQMNNLVIHFEDLPGPSYTIKEIIGGNVIAVDHVNVAIEPMANSTFVNWKLESDVSGVIFEIDEIKANTDLIPGLV